MSLLIKNKISDSNFNLSVALASTTDGCFPSPIALSFDLLDVPRFIHIQELHGGPPCIAPSSTNLRAPWINRRNPHLGREN